MFMLNPIHKQGDIMSEFLFPSREGWPLMLENLAIPLLIMFQQAMITTSMKKGFKKIAFAAEAAA
jgi:hypothetical protein